MTTPPSNSVSELMKIAQEYQHNPNLHIALEPFKEVILLLRAKYATYDTITEMLKQKGMKVSETTVRKFCRIHQVEMKRLRNETDRKRRESLPSASTTTGTATSQERPPIGGEKRPSVSDMDKPGPKIAREDF
jgi:hypothetical protein